MPVSRLLVEGKHDAEIFGKLCAGRPIVEPGGSKGSIRPRAGDLRRDTKSDVRYVRDRDFDFVPAAVANVPTPDQVVGNQVLGWRWFRHELENYLLEPALVATVFGWDRTEFEAKLVEAAIAIRHYQAARWTIGQARDALPPAREFPTRPPDADREFSLPADMSESASDAWVRQQAGEFAARAANALNPGELTAAREGFAARLSETFLADSGNVLVWCSGKDLLAALQPWLFSACNKLFPAGYRSRVKEWIVDHPAETLALLPEWAELLRLVKT